MCLSDAPFVEKDAGPSYLARSWKEIDEDPLARRHHDCVCVCVGSIYLYVCYIALKNGLPIPHSFHPSRQQAQQDRCGCLGEEKKGTDASHPRSFLPLNKKKRNLHPKGEIRKKKELDYELCGAKNVIAAPNRPPYIPVRSAGYHWQMPTRIIIRVRRKKKKELDLQFLLISFRPMSFYSRFVGFKSVRSMWTQYNSYK